ncbi:MAG TPA: hypothetical protein VIK29_07115 [Paludibacter sp.]
MKTIEVTPEKAEQLHEEAMVRMRWRLWYAFAESKYPEFRYHDNKKQPDFNNIRAYCLKHWGVEIGNMTKVQLQEKIAIVTKWKNTTNDKAFTKSETFEKQI